MVSFVNQKVDVDYAIIVGDKLAESRVALSLSVNEMADFLLLSPSQILSIESGVLRGFYGPRQYGQAVKKYAAYVESEIDLKRLVGSLSLVGDVLEPSDPLTDVLKVSDTLVAPVESDEIAAVDSNPNGSLPVVTSHATWFQRYGLFMVWLVVSCCLTVGVLSYGILMSPDAHQYLVSAQAMSSETPLPRTPEPIQSEPIVLDTNQESLVEIKTSEPCWVQVEHVDGTVTKQTTQANTQLTFDRGSIKSLVIGNATAAKLLVNGREQGLEPFIRPNSTVARIQSRNGILLLEE